MFGDQQLGALADIIQTALMLVRYNKRKVGCDIGCSVQRNGVVPSYCHT
jgi:hypothetical protein